VIGCRLSLARLRAVSRQHVGVLLFMLAPNVKRGSSAMR
jgi:hypothetical protein